MSRYIVIDQTTNAVTNIVIGQSLDEIQALHPGALVFDAEREAVGPGDLWLPESQSFEPAPPPDPEALPFQPLSAWDFRKLLTKLGIRQAAEAYVSQADQETQDAYAYANSFERDDPMLKAAIAALKLDPAVVDAAWRELS